MYSNPRKILFGSSFMLAAAGAMMLTSTAMLSVYGSNSAYAADTVAQQLTNARQETQIWTTYALSPYLRANDLKVSVADGKATLTGSVEDGVNKDLAKQIALGVEGVKEVNNMIVVQSDYTPPARSSERSYGELIDDATITAMVKSTLLYSSNVHGNGIVVNTNDGVVSLSGDVGSGAERALAIELAKNVRGVRSVESKGLII